VKTDSKSFKKTQPHSQDKILSYFNEMNEVAILGCASYQGSYYKPSVVAVVLNETDENTPTGFDYGNAERTAAYSQAARDYALKNNLPLLEIAHQTYDAQGAHQIAQEWYANPLAKAPDYYNRFIQAKPSKKETTFTMSPEQL
jgi:hypothetical protein